MDERLIVQLAQLLIMTTKKKNEIIKPKNNDYQKI